jgi:hypothetical protein
MTPYAEKEIFTEEEISLFYRANDSICVLSSDDFPEEIRCHELARAAGRILDLPCTDGWYGSVNHTWLWTRHPTHEELELWSKSGWFHEDRPRILDVYLPGVIPSIALIDTWALLPQWKFYKPGPPREDIDYNLVDRMVERMNATDPTRASTRIV